MPINALRLGLIFGLFVAIMHIAWAALVALGWAQHLMDFVFWAHFIAPPLHIEPFAWSRAAILIGAAFVVGTMFGFIGGSLWNWLSKR